MKKLKIVLFVLIAALIYLVTNIVSICLYSNKDETCKADVAIVLGASTNNGVVSPVYQERIHHAIDLYQHGDVEKLIMTGGVGKGSEKSDAAAAKEYAKSKGVPAKDILIEETSTITQENLENAKKVMDENGDKTALIVSDPLHMKRAMLLARDAGLTAYSSPTRTTRYMSFKTQIPFLARETFFYIGYKWFRIFR